MNIKYLLVAALFIFSSWCVMAAEDAATTLIATDIRQEPFIDAQVITNLPANASLNVLKRQGGWIQVKANSGEQGWLKMTSVRLGAGAGNNKGDSGFSSLFNVARSGRSGNTGVTVTTGVRGLSQEDLKNASPAPDAVKKMDAFPKGAKEAESFASAAKLQAQQVDYLVESKPIAEATKSFFGGSRK